MYNLPNLPLLKKNKNRFVFTEMLCILRPCLDLNRFSATMNLCLIKSVVLAGVNECL